MRIVLIFTFLCLSNALFAQKILRLETVKNPKKLSYLIGETLIFRLDDDAKDNKIWFVERIVDLDVDRQLIVFDNWQVPISDVQYVRKGAPRRLLKNVATGLKTFGAGVTFFSLAGRLTPYCANCNEALGVGVVSMVTGFLIDWLSPN